MIELFCYIIFFNIYIYMELQVKIQVWNDLENVITDKTRLIILNTPSNPTGSVMTPDELKKVANICKKYDIYLLSDEIYGRLIFNNSSISLSDKV